MKKQPFRLRSGNSAEFKELGSSPVKGLVIPLILAGMGVMSMLGGKYRKQQKEFVGKMVQDKHNLTGPSAELTDWKNKN